MKVIIEKFYTKPGGKSLEQAVKKAFSSKVKLYKILKKSIDARNKNNVKIVWKIILEGDSEKLQKLINKNIAKHYIEEKEEINFYNITTNCDVVIAGTGPAGIFAGLYLAKSGFNIIFLEKGKKIEERKEIIKNYFNEKIFDKNTNIYFGEGGAGTFSDGKLTTRRKSKFNNFILETFVETGAPKEILYLNHPHIGSDNLPKIVKNLRKKLENLNAQFFFEEELIDFEQQNNKIIVKTNKRNINCDILILATGQANYNIYHLLDKKSNCIIDLYPPIGFRVEHKQHLIDTNQYGNFAKFLPAAEYFLKTRLNDRSIYSFCMCPGGIIVPANTEKNTIVTNGMSNFARNSGLSNAAIVITMKKEDIEKLGFSGKFASIKFREHIEKLAFELGEGKAPVQRIIDFLKNKTSPIGTLSSFPLGSNPVNLNKFLPEYLNNYFKKAFKIFDKKIQGFVKEGIMVAVESRVSAPVRVLRNEETKEILGLKNVYFIGEGSGYASGIMTSAIDGLKIAETITNGY